MEKEEEDEKRSKPVRLCACGKRIRSPRSSANQFNKKHHCEKHDDLLPDDARAAEEDGDDDEDEEVTAIDPPEQASNGERMRKKSKARQLLVEAIQARLDSHHATTSNSDDSHRWNGVQVCGLLGVEATQEILELLVLACDAIAERLRQQMHQGKALDFLCRKRSSATSLIEILSLLSRSNELVSFARSFWFYPFAGIQDEPTAPDVRDSFDQARINSLSASARSQAAMDLVDRVTSVCTSLMRRMEQHERERKANKEHETQVHQSLQGLLCRLIESVDGCSVQLLGCESTLEHARQEYESRTLQLRKLVLERQEQLIEEGESESSADWLAHEFVMRSSDRKLSLQRYCRAESELNLKQCEQKHMKAKTELTSSQGLLTLMAHVKEQRERSLEAIMHHFEALYRAFSERAAYTLTRCIPILASALHVRFEFLSKQQTMAKEDLEQYQQELSVHTEYLGDAIPSKRRELEVRIREGADLVDHATRAMLELAEAQRRLWNDKKDLLPRSVWETVAREYSKLWRQLNGSVCEASELDECVAFTGC